MTKKPDAAFLSVLDGVLKDYIEDAQILFPGTSVARRLQFESVRKLTKARQAPRDCLWPECTNPSIARSHTISKAGALRLIAQDGHLIAPGFSQTRGRMESQRIGVNEASTVPAYCSEHEQEFAEFEVTGRIDTERGLARQLFRSVCREIIRLEADAASGRDAIAQYDEFCRSQIERLIRERSGQAESVVRSVSQNPTAQEMEARVQGLESALSWCRSRLYPEAASGLHDHNLCGLEVHALRLDVMIPVCLSGMGSFQVESSGSVVHVNAVLTVIPDIDGTVVAIAVAGEQRDQLALYRHAKMQGMFQILSAVETWMIHGTDHWFLNPRVWAEVQAEDQQALLDAIQDGSRGLGSTIDRTIFNRLKREWLTLLEADPKTSSADLARLRNEIPRFTDGQAG